MKIKADQDNVVLRMKKKNEKSDFDSSSGLTPFAEVLSLGPEAADMTTAKVGDEVIVGGSLGVKVESDDGDLYINTVRSIKGVVRK